jgi:ribosomal protein S12 methylthiotransferase accessory factor
MSGPIVEVLFSGGKKIDAQIGEFTIRTDQSEKYGGEASAPEPFDLFLSSIACCAGIFALNFCEARKLSTQGLALKMACERDEKQKRFARMELILTLPEGFPEKYRDGMVRAINQCAVKKHIIDPPEFAVSIEP